MLSSWGSFRQKTGLVHPYLQLLQKGESLWISSFTRDALRATSINSSHCAVLDPRLHVMYFYAEP